MVCNRYIFFFFYTGRIVHHLRANLREYHTAAFTFVSLQLPHVEHMQVVVLTAGWFTMVAWFTVVVEANCIRQPVSLLFLIQE